MPIASYFFTELLSLYSRQEIELSEVFNLNLCICVLQSVIQSHRSSFLVALGKNSYIAFC